MKTSEFIKYFRDEDQYAYKFSNSLLVQDEDDYTLIDLCDDVGIDINIGHLPFSKQQEYYKVIFEYLMTPLEEREEEKRYYLRQMGIGSWSFLNFNINSQEYGIAGKGDDYTYKTQFTQSEIDELPECYTHPAVWERIEVESED